MHVCVHSNTSVHVCRKCCHWEVRLFLPVLGIPAVPTGAEPIKDSVSSSPPNKPSGLFPAQCRSTLSFQTFYTIHFVFFLHHPSSRSQSDVKFCSNSVSHVFYLPVSDTLSFALTCFCAALQPLHLITPASFILV